MPVTPKAPLAIVALATLLSLVVFTLPLTTLEAMTAALGLGPAQQAWIMSGMPLGAACGLLIAGAFGDTLGRRRTFVGGLWLTALASVAAALAPTGLFLIVARVVQGLGSAGIMACGLGLLGQIYEGEPRRRAAAIWAAGLGAGVALGPILAAALLPIGGWPAGHWAIALAATILALSASARLPESPRSPHRVDLTGGLLLMLGLGCLLSALTELRLGAFGVVGLLALGALAFLALFLRTERRAPNPILRLDLFAHAPFTGATLAAFASGAGVLALMSLVPTVLVRGMGQTPLTAAFVLLAWSALTAIAALNAHRLPARWTSRQRVIGGIVGCGVGQALMLLATPAASWAILVPGLLIAGVSNGILNAALGHEAVQSVPPERAAMGSAANNTARYLGSALGIALISILIAGRDGERFFAGWHEAVVMSTLFSGLAVFAMLGLARERGSLGAR
ncbi:MFS transporter [Thioclava sp. F36-7]|uniref:MFS transporter n=1 Tax=Thioclava sp. F36-7 TaxID=1915317 RepID=UPI0009962182|nr:MFS transporter [Thioclava sp. F36-7]OOY08233.1 hypothetical protein BMI89_12020 [Thioclava sp. F36-7]